MTEPYRAVVLPDDETRERLAAALNDILTFGADNLPPGWEINVSMTGDHICGAAWISLTDPDGKVRSDEWDTERMNVWSMVKFANNVHVKEPEDGDDE